jgi:hypothetical protein
LLARIMRIKDAKVVVQYRYPCLARLPLQRTDLTFCFPIMSPMRRRFASVASSLRSASRFCVLYFVTPTASSKIARRSSGRELRSIDLARSIIEYAARPMPVSAKRFTMSRNRQDVLFSRYSELPSR